MSHRILLMASALTLGLTTGSFGVDGVVLIDQARALAGNVSPGDAPGFPVTLTLTGSYRLSGNLTVPNANTTGIEVRADDVSVDLNGFSIIGPVVCTVTPVLNSTLACVPTGGSGTGIDAFNFRGLALMNGTVRGMGAFGVGAGANCRLNAVQAFSNGSDGLRTGLGCRVTGSIATHNRGAGMTGFESVFDAVTAQRNNLHGFDLRGGSISKSNASLNFGGGIIAVEGTLVTNNTLAANQGTAVEIDTGTLRGNQFTGGGANTAIRALFCLVEDNVVLAFSGVALQAVSRVPYRGNFFDGGVNVQGSGGINLGQNLCGAVLCP